MGTLEGRPAIVTGGGRGVGQGIALALAAEGATVAVLGRTKVNLQDTCDEIERRGGRAIPVVCDVRELDDIERSVATVARELGGVRILVNNAQTFPYGTLLEIEESTIDDGWRSGPLAALRLMRTCYPYLRDGGSIVNLSSAAGYNGGPLNLFMYAAVKAAMQSLSRSAAHAWGPDGIRVNVLIPLATSPSFEDWQENNPEAFQQLIKGTFLRRIGDPEHDIGRAVAFLVGPDASFITGAAFPVDGGSLYLR
jgi:meso-butanediol dehydrogenase/(S,S)-butanediol dehydrogenase/diacetyl reductase